MLFLYFGENKIYVEEHHGGVLKQKGIMRDSSESFWVRRHRAQKEQTRRFGYVSFTSKLTIFELRLGLAVAALAVIITTASLLKK